MQAPKAQTPELINVGPLAIVVPDASVRFTPSVWRDLSCAVGLESIGATDAARELITDLEHRLGVNDAHRRALDTSPDHVRRLISEGRRRRRLEASIQAARVHVQPRLQEVVDALAHLARQAQAKRAEATALRQKDEAAGTRLHRRQAKALEAAARRLDEKAKEIRDEERRRDSLYGEAKAAIVRAAESGENLIAPEVTEADWLKDEFGVLVRHRSGNRRGLPMLNYRQSVRLRRLTGIAHAYESGHLGLPGTSQALWLKKAADDYRDAFEVAVGQASGGGGEGGGGFGPKGPQVRQIEAGEHLAAMRQFLTPRQLVVLNKVCGEDKRLRTAATEMGAGFPATVRALRLGLRAAVLGLRKARDEGNLGDAARRAAAVHKLLSKLRT